MADTFITTLVDEGGQVSRMQVEGTGVTGAKIKTFLDAYSLAGITGCSKNTLEAIVAKDAEVGSNIDKKAIITLKKPSTGEIRKVVISSPDPAAVETQQTENGERITSDALGSIKTAWATMTGETDGDWIATRGIIIQQV
jgi:hypothetical protein